MLPIRDFSCILAAFFLSKGEILFKLPVISLIVAMAIIAIAAGCGDDDGADADAGTTSAMTREEFVKQVNKICAVADKKIVKRYLAYSQEHAGTVKGTTAFKALLIPDSEAQLEKIRELPVPEGEDSQVEAIVVAMDEGLERAKQPSVKSVNQFIDELAQFDKLAKQYGIDACLFDLSKA